MTIISFWISNSVIMVKQFGGLKFSYSVKLAVRLQRRGKQFNNRIKTTIDRKVILYIAVSLDGYIAKPNDDLGFLSIVQQEGQDYGYADFVKTVDAVIIGRRTYDKVLSMGFGFPHADKETYVITRTSKPNIDSVKFYTGNLKSLIERLKFKRFPIGDFYIPVMF